ncbi:cytochrome P450 6a8-like isoform X2 [Anticarsia gemmatalis]
MRNMFPLIEKCSREFEKLLEEEVGSSNVIKANCIMTRFTLDCVGSAAFGVEPKVMEKDFENNHFKKMSERIFEQSTYRGYKNICRAVWPSIFYGLGFHSYRREIKDFFSSLLTEVFKQRDYTPSARHDFVDLILAFAKNEYLVGDSIKRLKTGEFEKVSIKVDDELLASQCVSFLGAGYETSATTLGLILFEMAKHPYTQEKAFKELDQYLDEHDNILNYDCVSKLPYLEACIDEALRLYPSLPNMTREVMEDYTFPTGLRVEKGLRIHLPIWHIQRNAAYFPEPETFRPERFIGEEKANIRPYTYMPFGEGYRICIGLRFAKMQILAGLVTVFKSYRLELADGQPTTLKFDPRVVVNKPTSNIFLKFIPREDGRRFKRIAT